MGENAAWIEINYALSLALANDFNAYIDAARRP